MAKRTARRQITKDATVAQHSEADSSSSSDEEHVKKKSVAPVNKANRVMSKPVSMGMRSATQENPFKGLVFPKPLVSSSVSGLEKTNLNANNNPTGKTLNEGQKEAMRNVKALNKAFSTAVEQSLQKDEFIDLTSLFGQYTAHRKSLDDRFNRFLSFKPTSLIELGFTPSLKVPEQRQEEIRPVSVDLPQFAVSNKEKQVKLVKDPEPVINPPSPQSQQPKPFSFPPLSSLPSFTAMGTSKPAFTFGSETSETTTSSVDEGARSALSLNPPKNEQLDQPKVVEPKPFSFPKLPDQPEQKPFAFLSGEQKIGETKSFSFPAPAFSFATPTFTPSTETATTSADQESRQEQDSGDEIPAGEEDSFTSARSNLDLVVKGEGEEGEREVFPALRVKIYAYDQAKAAWDDLGIGMVKVNVDLSDGNKHRILARAEGSGRVLLNGWLTKGVAEAKHVETSRDLNLTLFVSGKLTRFLIRAKHADDTRRLFDCVSKVLS